MNLKTSFHADPIGQGVYPHSCSDPGVAPIKQIVIGVSERFVVFNCHLLSIFYFVYLETATGYF